MSNPVIVDAIRTPIGALGGVLASVRPDDMAAHVIKSILERNSFDPRWLKKYFLDAQIRPVKIIATWHAWRHFFRGCRCRSEA